jgi:SAM-dependent methyltransferase
LGAGEVLMQDPERCRICDSKTVRIGSKLGKSKPDLFFLRHCPVCHFSFVSNPRIEYRQIYSAEYYAGNGADPLVNYLFELEQPQKTVRVYEWRGILKIVKSLTVIRSSTNWLDYGCGNGGLLRYCLESERCRIVGFEEGWIKDKVTTSGIPLVDSDQLDASDHTFDIITAIEVLEHVAEPLEFLKRIRRLLKPGGLFFYTTGNAQPFRDNLQSWRYVLPEVHVSFFEPETMARALALTGFRPEFRGFLPGFTDVIRFKVLKNLRVHQQSTIEQIVPWEILARLVDLRLKITAHPVGWGSTSQ